MKGGVRDSARVPINNNTDTPYIADICFSAGRLSAVMMRRCWQVQPLCPVCSIISATPSVFLFSLLSLLWRALIVTSFDLRRDTFCNYCDRSSASLCHYSRFTGCVLHLSSRVSLYLLHFPTHERLDDCTLCVGLDSYLLGIPTDLL